MTKRSPYIVVTMLCCLLALWVVGLFIWPLLALAWNEPDSFRGVPWGAAVEDAQTRLGSIGLACVGKSYCGTRTTVGNIAVHLGMTFRDDKLVGGELSFKSDQYPELRAIFLERYGKPTAREEKEFKTKGGLTATNEMLRWTGEKVEIWLRAYTGTIDDGNASITLRTEMERQAAERQQQIKKGKDDL